MGLVLDVVGGCAVDAGVVDAAEHEHLFVGLVAHHAGLLLLVALKHLNDFIMSYPELYFAAPVFC